VIRKNIASLREIEEHISQKVEHYKKEIGEAGSSAAEASDGQRSRGSLL
jgi:hypothetical protein